MTMSCRSMSQRLFFLMLPVLASAPLIGCTPKSGEPHKETVNREWTDEAGVHWVNLPAGTFTSAAPSSVAAISAFRIAKTETTVAQFKKCLAAGACEQVDGETVAGNAFCNIQRGDAYSNHPMNCVTWREAKQFCEWVGGRLPTADEWEYAATHDGQRALQTTYPWGDVAPNHCAHACYEVDTRAMSLYCDSKKRMDFYTGTVAVGTYSPTGDSPLGLQNMADNVREWTASNQTLAGADARETAYVVKGGACYIGDAYLPVTVRDVYPSTVRGSSVGFRCAADVR